MKYFYNPESSMEEWIENCQKYNDEFNNIKHLFSKKFLIEYAKKGFHDCFLYEYGYFNKKHSLCFYIKLKDTKYCHIITYNNIFSVDIHFSKPRSNDLCVFLYDEFSLHEKGLSHEFSLADEGNIKIVFKKLLYKKVKRQDNSMADSHC